MRTIFVLLCLTALSYADTPVQRVMIIEEAQKVAANKIAVTLFGPNAIDTFSVAMKGPGGKIYYICAWALPQNEFIKFRNELNKLAGTKPIILKKVKNSAGTNEFTGSAVAELKKRNFKPKEIKK